MRGTGAGATALVAYGATVNGVATFAFQVVGTRALGAVDYAPIGVLWTLQYLWIAIAVTAIEAYVTRLVALGTRASALRRFLRVLSWWLAAAAIGVTVVALALRGPMLGGDAALAPVLGAVVLAYGWYGVARGRQAGAGAFGAYAAGTAGEAVVRLVAAVAVLAAMPSAGTLAWTLPLGALVMATWLQARTPPALAGAPQDTESPTTSLDAGVRSAGSDAGAPGSGQDAAPGTGSPDAGVPARWAGRRFLAATSTANACIQVLLAGAPIAMIPLGADAASVSVAFTTVTAMRIPMSFALNGGLSRLLPPLAHMAGEHDTVGLARASRRIVAAVVGTALLAAAAGLAIGAEAIALVFGAQFRPERAFVAVIALSTVLAVGGLLIDQVWIAMGRQARLPATWLTALLLAAVLVGVLPGTPAMRVAVAFAVATTVAVAVLAVPLLRVAGRPLGADSSGGRAG